MSSLGSYSPDFPTTSVDNNLGKPSNASYRSAGLFDVENHPDLALVVKAWDTLPDAIRRAILALVGTSKE